jgi:Zn-dependent protease
VDVAISTSTVLPPPPAPPEAIHNCPSCSHWLPEGTLACPECQTLTYSQHLGRIAYEAQQLEQEQKWAEARDRWRSALQWLPAETAQAETLRTHIAQIDTRLQRVEDQKARWTRRLGPFAPIALFVLKFKTYLFLLLKMKFLLSLLGFFAIYWVIFGWKFAAGFTVGILVHEMGHYLAAKRRGLKVDLPMFVPGMGAYVRWYNTGVSREDLAGIALAGPLFGLTTALVFLAMWFAWHLQIFVVLAYVTAWLNVVNLIPVFIFDGAPATYALSRMQRWLVAATCVLFFGLTITDGNPFGPSTQWSFLVVGLAMVWRCFTNDEPEQGSTNTFLYFQGLLVVLGLVVLYTTSLAAVR